MDTSKVKAIADRELAPLMQALGIDRWGITVEYGPLDPGSLPNGRKAAGECDANPNYDRADIGLDPEQLDDERDVIRVLRHELLHVVLTPFNLYRRYAIANVDAGTVADHQEQAIWDHAVERAVIHLERMFDGLLKYQKRRK